MGGRVAKMKSDVTKKGFFALVAGVGTGALYVYTFWPIGVVGTVGTLFLTFKWFKARAEIGMRF